LGYTKEIIIEVEKENRELKKDYAASQSSEKDLKEELMKLKKLKQSLKDENDGLQNNLNRL